MVGAGGDKTAASTAGRQGAAPTRAPRDAPDCPTSLVRNVPRDARWRRSRRRPSRATFLCTRTTLYTPSVCCCKGLGLSSCGQACSSSQIPSIVIHCCMHGYFVPQEQPMASCCRKFPSTSASACSCGRGCAATLSIPAMFQMKPTQRSKQACLAG